MNHYDTSWNRARTQRCIQKFDWYANPVTLTYNQQKKFTTVNGAICTGITSLLLLYLISVAFAQQLLSPTFVHSVHYSVQSTIEPEPYNVGMDQLIVLSNISQNKDW